MSKKTFVKTLFCVLIGLFFIPYQMQAAEQDFLVSKIKLTGNSVLSSQNIAPLLNQYEGKRLTFAQLKDVAALVTKEYHDKGYILAKVYIPEQKIANGIIELVVLEGKIGQIKLQGKHDYYSDDFIKKHFNPVIKAGALNQDKLEWALLVLNEYPKLEVTATLEAGSQPGTTDILVTAKNSMPINFTVDYNNFGSKYTSVNRYGATLDVGNFITEGAIFSVRGTVGDDPSEMAYGRVSYSMPVNELGTKVGAYYTRGTSDVGRELAVLQIKGDSESYGFFINHPILKKRQYKLDVEVSFDAKNTKQEILDTITSTDKVRSVKGGLLFASTDTVGRDFVSFFVTQGLGETLGAMKNDSTLSSRAGVGANNSFTKYNLDAMRLQKIVSSLYLIMKGSAQWASTSLVASEQFGIGGPDTVRGFPSSEYVGDDGFALTAELRVAPFENKENYQLAFFVDHGGMSLKEALPGQTKSATITGGGGGIRVKLPYDIDLKADVGFPLDPSKSSEGKAPVYYIQVAKKF